MAQSLYEQIQNYVATTPKPIPQTGGNVTVDPNNMKLPNQRSKTMPSYLFQLLQHEKNPDVYEAPSFDYGNQATQAAEAQATAVTSTPAAKQAVAAKAAQQQDDKRPRGRAATILTSPQGLLDSPNINRRSLLGF